jgi:hypothetical protein
MWMFKPQTKKKKEIDMTHSIGIWMGPRADIDGKVKRQVSTTVGKRTLAVQHVFQSPY